MTLRQRLANSERLSRWLAKGLGAYLALCNRTTRWQIEGLDALREGLATGPVLLVMWHGRTLLAPAHWPRDAAAIISLHDGSPIGRIGGGVQAYFGTLPVRMSGTGAGHAATRAVMRAVRDRHCIGVSCDGPRGPARVMNSVATDWARASGYPVWAYAFATTRKRRLDTWDRMLMPRPFGRGAIVFRRLDGTAPRRMDAAAMQALTRDIGALLDSATDRADEIVGDRAHDA